MDRIQHLRFRIAKCVFSLGFKYLWDGHTGAAFEDDVRVEEIVGSHSSGEGVADGGFSGSHHSNEVDVASFEAGGEEAGWIDFEGFGFVFGGCVRGGGWFEEVGVFEGVFDSGICLVGGGIFPFESSGGEDCGSGIMDGGCYGCGMVVWLLEGGGCERECRSEEKGRNEEEPRGRRRHGTTIGAKIK